MLFFHSINFPKLRSSNKNFLSQVRLNILFIDIEIEVACRQLILNLVAYLLDQKV